MFGKKKGSAGQARLNEKLKEFDFTEIAEVVSDTDAIYDDYQKCILSISDDIFSNACI